MYCICTYVCTVGTYVLTIRCMCMYVYVLTYIHTHYTYIYAAYTVCMSHSSALKIAETLPQHDAVCLTGCSSISVFYIHTYICNWIADREWKERRLHWWMAVTFWWMFFRLLLIIFLLKRDPIYLTFISSPLRRQRRPLFKLFPRPQGASVLS